MEEYVGLDVSMKETSVSIRRAGERIWRADGSGVRIEEFASLKHRMHNNRQLARHGHGGSFEADPLPELQTPSSQPDIGARTAFTARYVDSFINR